MTEKKQKKINNRFDEWEILSTFVESTDDFMDDRYSTLNKKFYIKSILGILMAINAYLSHWGPWAWPNSYNYICFSIVFYYIASYGYTYLNDIDKSIGSKVGEYIVDGYKTIYLIKLTSQKLEYILEEVDTETKEIKRTKSFNYLEYFTKQGIFLENQYLKHLEGFLKSKKK